MTYSTWRHKPARNVKNFPMNPPAVLTVRYARPRLDVTRFLFSKKEQDVLAGPAGICPLRIPWIELVRREPRFAAGWTVSMTEEATNLMDSNILQPNINLIR